MVHHEMQGTYSGLQKRRDRQKEAVGPRDGNTNGLPVSTASSASSTKDRSLGIGGFQVAL